VLERDYIRVLAEDLAKALGTCGHVTLLRRCMSSRSKPSRSETLESVAKPGEQGGLARVLPCRLAPGSFTEVSLAAAEVTRLMHGQGCLDRWECHKRWRRCGDRVRLLRRGWPIPGNRRVRRSGTVRPRRLFSGLQDPPLAGAAAGLNWPVWRNSSPEKECPSDAHSLAKRDSEPEVRHVVLAAVVSTCFLWRRSRTRGALPVDRRSQQRLEHTLHSCGSPRPLQRS